MSDDHTHTYTFYATGVEAQSGEIMADDGVVHIHCLTFTNTLGQTVEVVYPPELARHVANAAQAAIMADVRQSIARTMTRRIRAAKRSKS